MTDHPIGKPIPRKEGRKKVTGQALYVDDLSFPDMLHGTTVRSPAARGKITNISFDGIEAESLLIALDLEGVAVSTGSACSSGTLEPSHVLKAMGFPLHRTQNAIRFSLGAANTAAEIDHVLAILPPIVERLRKVTAGQAAHPARDAAIAG